MKGFIPELLHALTSNNQVAILTLGQSQIRNGFECLMVSLRFGEKAMPVTWAVKKTKGEIGYNEQEAFLKAATAC